MALNTTPRTWVASEVVTATEMNTEIRDAITGIQAAAVSFTSTLTATTTNPTVGTGSSQSSFYYQQGKLIHAWIDFTFGSSGFVAGSGQYLLSLPVTPTGPLSIGSGHFLDSSTNIKYLIDCRASSGGLFFMFTDGIALGLSATTPVTPANGDSIHVHLTFQAA